MKRLVIDKMTVVYSQESFPKDEMKSIFLAGPVPRKEYELSWKNEALEILDSMGYNGVVYIPENRNPEQKEENFDLEKALSDLDKDIKEFVTTDEFEKDSAIAGYYWAIAKHAFLLGLKVKKGEEV